MPEPGQDEPGQDEPELTAADVNARLAAPAPHRPGHIPAGPRGTSQPADWMRTIRRTRWR